MNTTLLITGAIVFAGALLLAWLAYRQARPRQTILSAKPTPRDRISRAGVFYGARAPGRRARQSGRLPAIAFPRGPPGKSLRRRIRAADFLPARRNRGSGLKMIFQASGPADFLMLNAAG